MIQIRFQSELELSELESLKSKIYERDSEAKMNWFADMINYNVRVEISSKIPKLNIEQIKCLCEKAAIGNYIEIYNQP